MQDRMKPKDYGDTWLLPEDELATRRRAQPVRLIEDQPDEFVKPRPVPEDVSIA